MKRFIVLVLAGLVVLLAIHRQRVFLRDPLGKVYRNNVRLPGARVYINYSNDVVVEETDRPRTYMVQGWNRIPGLPQALMCLRGMVCWADADQATQAPLEGIGALPETEMSDREVSFRERDGTRVRITLR